MNKTKKRFEKEANSYDESISNIIPFYNNMIEALINAIPFNNDDEIAILDLGCGTGNISELLINKFPNSHCTCLDLAENMIEITKNKLKSYENMKFLVGDFSDFDFNQEYDVIVSSLAIHHIKENKEKIKLFQKIFNSLKKEGVFYNADVVSTSSNYLKQLNLDKWIEFMRKNYSKDVYSHWINNHKEGDYPSKLTDQLIWLKEVGFTDVDVIWKYYGHCVYGGKKD